MNHTDDNFKYNCYKNDILFYYNIDIIIIIHLLINVNYNVYKRYNALFILMSFLGCIK